MEGGSVEMKVVTRERYGRKTKCIGSVLLEQIFGSFNSMGEENNDEF